MCCSHMKAIKVCCLLDPQAPTTTGCVRLKWWTNKRSSFLPHFCCLPSWTRWAETRRPHLFPFTSSGLCSGLAPCEMRCMQGSTWYYKLKNACFFCCSGWSLGCVILNECYLQTNTTNVCIQDLPGKYGHNHSLKVFLFSTLYDISIVTETLGRLLGTKSQHQCRMNFTSGWLRTW